MNSVRTMLLASAAIAVIAGPQTVAAANSGARPLILAQADVPEAVTAAQAKVQEARAALRKAMADGQGVEEARQALGAAVQELNDARVAAGLKPVAAPDINTAEQPAKGKKPPAQAEAPPAAGEKPPAAAEAPPPADAPKPPAAAEAPPPAEKQAPAAAEAPPPADKQAPAAAEAPPPADKQAPAAAEAPPAPGQKAPATAGNPPAPRKKPMGPANAEAPPPPEKPAAPAAAEAPPAPNSPPAAQAQGQQPKFDPSQLKKPHPRFGEGPKTEEKVQLPKDEAAIPKGGEIQAGAGRVIVKEDDGQVTVRHDDSDRFRRQGGNVDVQRGRDGTTTTTVTRPDGTQVVTIKDRDGDILQRYRKNRNGSIEVLIGDADPQRGGRRPPPPPKPQGPSITFDFHNKLPPLRLQIPQNQYIVESSRASRQQLEQTFMAPPVENVERAYTLEEIRRSDRLREKVRRVDFDTVTFEFGSAVLPDDQIPQVQKVGEAMRAVLDKDPDQVFLIEGHTDAVGSDLANLALSDRRAETVAEILTYYFNIPPENLVTQGYGEQYLKVPTAGPERENRRVAFRNITPLMQVGAR